MSSLFRLRNISRAWGRTRALRDVSLTINPGETVVLAGPNGSGKSTLLRILAGVLRPTDGTIEIDGHDVMAMSARQIRRHQRRCGIVEQGGLLVPQLDVHHNVLAGRLAHMPWHRVVWSAIWHVDREAVGELLDILEIRDKQWDPIDTLSGGQQQRVAIARALISSPSIILADEPTSYLDPRTAIDVSRLLVEQAKSRKATLILSSHWLNLVLDHVDRVLGLRWGHIVVDAPASEVSHTALDGLYKGTTERVVS